jgi:hypothetical protein
VHSREDTRTPEKTSDKESQEQKEEQERSARKKCKKGGGATTRTPGLTPDRESQEQERRARRAVEEPLALQDGHQTGKEKEAQLEFLAPVCFRERYWHSTSPPLLLSPYLTGIAP